MKKTSDQPKPHSWWKTLPGLITAIAGLLGAIASLLLALRPPRESLPVTNDLAAGNRTQKVGTQQKAGSQKPLVVARTATIRLKLENVSCLNDGSWLGGADWNFDVEYNGTPIIQLRRHSYNDKSPGPRSGTELAATPPEATIALPEQSNPWIEIIGYHSFGNKRSATGRALVTPDGMDSPVDVVGDGHFKFAFSVTKM